MKKLLVLLTFAAVLFVGCNKDDGKEIKPIGKVYFERINDTYEISMIQKDFTCDSIVKDAMIVSENEYIIDVKFYQSGEYKAYTSLPCGPGEDLNQQKRSSEIKKFLPYALEQEKAKKKAIFILLGIFALLIVSSIYIMNRSSKIRAEEIAELLKKIAEARMKAELKKSSSVIVIINGKENIFWSGGGTNMI